MAPRNHYIPAAVLWFGWCFAHITGCTDCSEIGPTADAGGDQTARVGQRVLLSGLVDVDFYGSTLTYHWEQTDGPPVSLHQAHLAETSFVADKPGEYAFVLTVHYGPCHSSDEARVTIEAGALPPVADAGADQTVVEGSLVRLNGVNSHDPDDGRLTFEWLQMEGPPVAIDRDAHAAASFMAPNVTRPTVLLFRLTVIDHDILHDEDTVAVNILDRGDPCESLDCDDRNSCTVDHCQGGECRHDLLSGCIPCAVDLDCPTSGDPCVVVTCTGGVCSQPARDPACGLPFADIALVPPLSPRDPEVTFEAVYGPQGRALTYAWCKLEGPGPVEFDSAAFARPTARFAIAGRYVIGVTVNDGQNEIIESVDVEVLATGPRPNDPGLFLTKPGLDDEASARAYYAAIDPTSQKDTLDKWKADNMLQTGLSTVAVLGNTLNGCCAAASYLNGVDLGFGRRMSMTRSGAGVAYSVTNYATVDDAVLDRNAIATVSMEYSPGPVGGEAFTKFYVFSDWNGDGVQERQLAADLDGRGQKFIPALCITCHGGTHRPLEDGRYPDGGNVGAKFLPFDLDGFEFSCLPGQSRADLEPSLRQLNLGILETDPTPAIRELIDGWYGPGAARSTQDNNFVPEGWRDEAGVYGQVVATSCRICHASRTGALDFNARSDFEVLREAIRTDVFDARIMPHALRTYDNFWMSTSPHRPDLLRDFLDAIQEPECIVAPSTLQVLEGGSASFTVGLTSDPASPETVTITPRDPSISITSGNTLTFSRRDPQIVTLLAAPDASFGDRLVEIEVTCTGTTHTVLVTILDPAPLFVDQSAAGRNDGASWLDAFTDLQDALDVALDDSTVREIWVAAGTYVPRAESNSGDLRSGTFTLVDGVSLFGGFAGSESRLEQRDISANPTVLSGDIGHDGAIHNNAYHVVTASQTDATAILDGFTITAGHASGPASGHQGAGLFIDSASPTIQRCTIIQNRCSGQVTSGAGVFCQRDSAPMFLSCAFIENHLESSADEPQAARALGAGVFSRDASPTFINCIFGGNVAFSVVVLGDGPAFQESQAHGAGLYNEASDPTLINCTLHGNACDPQNSSGAFGPAMFSAAGSRPTVINSIVWDNVDRSGAAPEPAQIDGDAADITFSCVQFLPLEGGSQNINEDPRFVDAAGADGFRGTQDDNLRLRPESPCVDIGNSASLTADATDLDFDGDFVERLPVDFAGQPRVSGGVDAGAFELQGATTPGLELSPVQTTLSEGQSAVLQVRLRDVPALPVTVRLAVAGDPSVRVQPGGEVLVLNDALGHSVTIVADEDADFTNGSASVQVTDQAGQIAPAAAQVSVIDNDLNGELLFATRCAACHQPCDKRNRSTAQIQNAIATIPAMRPLGNTVTRAEIEAVAAYLASLTSCP